MLKTYLKSQYSGQSLSMSSSCPSHCITYGLSTVEKRNSHIFAADCTHGGQHNELCHQCQLLIDVFQICHGLLGEKKNSFSPTDYNKLLYELESCQENITEYQKFHQRQVHAYIISKRILFRFLSPPSTHLLSSF